MFLFLKVGKNWVLFMVSHNLFNVDGVCGYMNKRGLISEIIVIVVLLIVGFFWFVGIFNGDSLKDEIVREKCVPDSCCHASKCVWEGEAPNCSRSFCTMSCEPETMDCGAGKCGIVDGKCEVVWNE